MPLRQDFDLYAALEVTKTATQDEITKSYKRLALIHHPDKNLNNPEATARFQQISTAYETLKDTDSRRRYDTPARPSLGGSGYSSPGSSSSGYYEDEYEMDMEEMFFHTFFGGRSGGNQFGGPGFGGGEGAGFFYGESGYSEYGYGGGYSRARQERESAARAREQQEAALRAQQRAEREMKVQMKRMVREAEKLVEEKKRETQLKVKLDREAKERAAQQQRWTDANAKTQAEKQAICSHTKFWPKEQQKKKFKCNDCGQKRGMTAFKCPHCAILVCQVCLQKFAAERNTS